MPRTPRLLSAATDRPAIYHCVSRVVNRDKVFKKEEKERFVYLMRLYERFCGVRILTYCVMSNHFHLQVEVPPRPAKGLDDKELFRRIEGLYGTRRAESDLAKIEKCRQLGDDKRADRLREKHLYRMWNLGEFMKSLKQCFSAWFNRKHERRGTLWEERYKSVLVEDGQAARVMAAYIDLNPVRAGMVKRPEQYRWGGYGEAMGGSGIARAGLERLMESYAQARGGVGANQDRDDYLAQYRVILFSDGEERIRENESTGQIEVVRRGFSPEEVAKVLEAGGKLSPGQMLRCRIRALSDGLVLGSPSFVDEQFEARREQIGAKRKKGARPLRGCETELCCLCDVRDGPVLA